MKTAILQLNATLLVLATIIFIQLIMQQNPWATIATYWVVTVVKNIIQLYKER